MEQEKEYKEIIKQNLGNTLTSGFIPELGMHKPGKVRDVHFTSSELGKPIVMVASDRISCFDNILSRQIPFKGRVLNLFTKWAFENTEDIVKNAMVKSPYENVVVQKRMNKIPFEFVVRGFVWGSMAADYEDGKREFCGIKMPDTLLRYQRLSEPLFTPATKAEDGDHDINVSFEYMAEKLGKTLATQLRNAAVGLFKRGAELASKNGFIFIDTKYEFGLDENRNIHLIDEANTPDSSRYCTLKEYEKFKLIEKEMATGKYKTVSELLEAKPELKISELSKQFARDVLVAKGFSYGSSGKVPDLSDEDVAEVAYRYISLYERLTGRKFKFPAGNVKEDMLYNLKKEGYIKGGVVVIIAGSDSDMPHIEKIQGELKKYSIPSEVKICSAHKQPAKCEEVVNKYNDSVEPVVFITIAGGTDALSGVVSYHSVHPVVSCPPDKNEFISCVTNPPGSSNSLILRPANVARHVAKILGHSNGGLKEVILKKNAEKIKKLEDANNKLRGC
ncbi:AIR carboxylase family protein [Candidatus Woesearchaeota archaeon]|nr:AIR carboxylase family protein [Candidatus Woesearchaeota archaeon]